MLKRRDGGRATFLPLTTIRPQTLQDTVCQRQPGFIAIASSLVSCDAQYRAVVENALGRTVICDTLDHAVPMARASGSRVRIVTLDGQVMNAGGSMTGGSAAKKRGRADPRQYALAPRGRTQSTRRQRRDPSPAGSRSRLARREDRV